MTQNDTHEKSTYKNGTYDNGITELMTKMAHLNIKCNAQKIMLTKMTHSNITAVNAWIKLDES